MQNIKISNIVIGLLIAALATSAVFLVLVIRTGFLESWAEEQYFGRITETYESGFIIAERTGKEISILVKNETKIMEGRRIMTAGALRSGDDAIVVGAINHAGSVEARIIRIFPAVKTRTVR